MKTIFNIDEYDNKIKRIAYGAKVPRPRTPMQHPQTFRTERGHPYQRAGKLVFATPQFRALAIYSLTNQNAQLPSQATVPGSINYPVKAK